MAGAPAAKKLKTDAPTSRDLSLTIGHYIDGAEVPSIGGETLEVRSPFDQSLVCTVSAAQPADVDRAVQAAAAAFADRRWSGLQPRQRARVLRARVSGNLR